LPLESGRNGDRQASGAAHRSNHLKGRSQGDHHRNVEVLAGRLKLINLASSWGRPSVDFVVDALSSGRRFRILTLVDDFTRECLGLVVDTSLTAHFGSRAMSDLSPECKQKQTLSRSSNRLG